MGSDDLCHVFEEAIRAESALDDALRKEMQACPRCAALAAIAALSASPIATEKSETLAQEVLDAAAEAAGKRNVRWRRRQRLAPLALGLAGYLLTAATLLTAAFSKGAVDATFPWPTQEVSLVPRPPDLSTVLAVLICSAVWLAAVAILAPRRCATVGIV